MNRLDIKIKDTTDSNKFKDQYIIILIDIICIKVINRGPWMQDKWRIKKQ